MKRGEVRWYRFDRPDKRRPVLILTRTALAEVLAEIVVAPATTVMRGTPAEVPLGQNEGMPRACVVNLILLRAVPRNRLGKIITQFPAERWGEVRRALLFALGFEP